MKTKIFGLIFLFIFVSCGNNEPGVQTTEIREVDAGFDSVESSGAYDILIEDGAADGKIKLEGDSNILKRIKVSVINNTLKISQKSGFYKSNGKSVKISFKAQNLSGLVLTGSGSITADGIQRVNDFKTVLDGSGDINVSIASKTAEIQLNGSGDIYVSGTTDKLNAGVAGSGDLHAYQLKANDVNAGMSGSGNLEVHSDQKLNAGVTGSGKLYYKGNPADTDLKTVGSGEVIKAD